MIQLIWEFEKAMFKTIETETLKEIVLDVTCKPVHNEKSNDRWYFSFFNFDWPSICQSGFYVKMFNQVKTIVFCFLPSCVEECHELLMGLKCTVERLLAVQASNVWSTYGGFKRVSSHIEAILCHRIKTTQVQLRVWLLFAGFNHIKSKETWHCLYVVSHSHSES